MTGSDWRDYELEYSSASHMYGESEFGFTYIFDLASKVGMDFWLFSGLMKCLYLYAQIRLIKLLTSNITTCLSISMVTTLLFMLVDYPMRFTAAATFVIFAMPYLFQKKVLRFFLLSSIGIIFHNTILITILVCLFCYYIPEKLLSINKYVLSIVFIAFALLASNFSRIAIVQEIGMAYFIESGMRSYSTYLIENNNSFYTLGSLINVFLACFVFFVKDVFLNEAPQNKLILKFAIVASFLFRVLLVIPVGYRLSVPLSIFSTIIIVSFCYRHRRKYIYFFFVLYILTLCKDLYNGFVYIPYSNSIPHIITQDHLPYDERDQYNFDKYKERKGRPFERND